MDSFKSLHFQERSRPRSRNCEALVRKEGWSAPSSRCLWAGEEVGGVPACPDWSGHACLSMMESSPTWASSFGAGSLSRAQTSRVTHFACYRGKRGCVRYAGLLLGHMGNTLGAKVPADVYKKSERARKKHDAERRKEGGSFTSEGKMHLEDSSEDFAFSFMENPSGLREGGGGGGPVQTCRHGAHDIHTHACKHTFTPV